MEELVHVPPCGFDIDPKSLKHLKHVGFLPDKQFLPNTGSLDGTKLNKYYHEYDPKLEKVPVPITHGYARTSWAAIKKQFMLFDHAPLERPDLWPEKEIDWATEEMINMLDYHGVETKQISLDDIEWNLSSSAGEYYQKQYGSKLGALTKGRHEIEEFMKNAHKVGAVPLWKVSEKQEFLKFDKLYEEDQRIFIIPDVAFLALCHSVNQSFNKQFDQLFGETWSAVGSSFQHGGFHKILSNLGFEFPVRFAGDVRKFDKYIHDKLREPCHKIRSRLYRGTNKEVLEILDYIFKHKMHAHCILPWRQIIQMILGMMSGDDSTTVDNTMMHYVVVMAMVKFYFPSVKSWRDVHQILRMKIYSDDHIGAAKDNAVGRFLAAFKNRSSFYSRCGLTLKPEDDVMVYNTWDGITFLGAKATKIGVQWMPKYDLSRIWSSLIFDNYRTRAPFDYYSKVYSLCCLSFGNGERPFNQIREYLKWLAHHLDQLYGTEWYPQSNVQRALCLELGVNAMSLPFIPTYEFVFDFYSGLEARKAPQIDHQRSEGRVLVPTKTHSGIKIRGNYCGPNWNNGRAQASQLDPSAQPIDEFDKTCLAHDNSYAHDSDLDLADFKFWRDNTRIEYLFADPIRYLSGIAVGLQGAARLTGIMSKGNNSKKSPNTSPKKGNNGSKPAQTPKKPSRSARRRQRNKARNGRPSANHEVVVPIARGVVQSRPKFSIIEKNGRRFVRGVELITRLQAPANTLYGDTLASWKLAPAAFAGTMLYAEGMFFEKFRFHKVSLVFKPEVSASTNGQILLYWDPDPTDIQANGNTGYSDGVSTDYHIETKIWEDIALLVDPTKEYPQPLFINPDVADERFNNQGALYIKSGSDFASLTSLGKIELHYICEFTGRMNQIGNIAQGGLVRSATNTGAKPFLNPVNDPTNQIEIKVSNTGSVSRFTFQCVQAQTYLLIIDVQGTSLTGTGPTGTAVSGCTLGQANYWTSTTGNMARIQFTTSSSSAQAVIDITSNISSGTLTNSYLWIFHAPTYGVQAKRVLGGALCNYLEMMCPVTPVTATPVPNDDLWRSLENRLRALEIDKEANDFEVQIVPKGERTSGRSTPRTL